MTDSRRLSRRGLHVLGVLLVVALVVPFVLYAVPETAGADESYVVLTASMSPEIAPGDAVLVREVPAGAVRVGDVITFQARGGGNVPVTHRVTDVVVLSDGTRTFVTRGDANEDVDAGVVTPDRLVGKVVFVVPYVGHVVGFVDSPVGFVVLVILPIGALIATEVADLVLDARRTRLGAATAAADDERPPGADDDGAAPSDPATLADATEPANVPVDGEITISRTDLTFTLGALAAFAAYAVYVALAGVLRSGTSDLDPVAVAVAVGAVATLALVAVLRRSIPAAHGAPAPDEPLAVADGGDEDDAPASPESSPGADHSEVDA